LSYRGTAPRGEILYARRRLSSAGSHDRKTRIAPKGTVTMAGMDRGMSQITGEEVLRKLRLRYQSDGPAPNAR